MNKFNYLILAIPLLIIFLASVFTTFYTFRRRNSTPELDTRTKNNLTLEHTTYQTPDPSEYKNATATFFWVGETASEANNFIPNDKSAWDANWQENFGGVDDPNDRCGSHPCSFTPKENPFYVALPYNDLDAAGNRKRSAEQVPWFETYRENKSILKNRWIEIIYGNTTCYGQWEDVGPLESDDFAYVFGSTAPKNSFRAKAGIDLSPALRDCLGMKTNDSVSWRFVENTQVPNGPWKEIITDSPVHW